jgi:Protein of unknown function (DUF1592)/Protein of unknown function (DUF1588)/Protein of unknown function (DUF1587)/Protein of unknown function (DUF1585)/Protein of unknown function (DUF1595)
VRSRIWSVSLGQFLLLVLGAIAPSARADVFQEKIEPFAKKYCHACHNKKQAKGELDLTRYTRNGDVTSDFRRWNKVIEFVRKGVMPPSDRKLQPTLEERDAVVGAVEAILLVEAKKHAGDPGIVLPRRLSNTEYELSIRDLTGVAIPATKEFPVDPAGGEGFNNTGEVLAMTPSLLNKYIGAAQLVSDHLVLKPSGITFAPFPVTSYAERTKLSEQAIIDFYRQREVRISDYLEAAWRYRHRDQAERGVGLEEWAARRKLSGKYLTLVSKTLNEAKTGAGYLMQLGAMWDAVPAPAKTGGVPQELMECDRFIGFARTQLNQREPALIVANAGNWPILHLDVRAKAAAGRDKFDPSTFKAKQTLKLGKLQLKKGEKPSATVLYLRALPAFDSPGGLVVFHRPVFSKADNLPKNKKDIETQGVESLRAVLEREAPDVAKRLGFGKHPKGGELDPDSFVVLAPTVVEIPLSPGAVTALQGKQLLVECELDGKSTPESAVEVQHAIGTRPAAKVGANVELLLRPESKLARDLTPSGERFCAAFPNRFFYVDANRGLAAGFHLVEGVFRDDHPLVNKVLTEPERKELDRLWKELDFITNHTETLLRGFVWFERSERHVLYDKRFDFLRSEDPDLVEEKKLSKFERLYLERLGVKLLDDEIKPQKANPQFDMIHGFFEQVRRGLAEYKQTLAKAEEPALADLERLAQRAYSRPLRAEEAKALRGLYQRLRKQGLGVEASLRGAFTAVLMSPHFMYRVPVSSEGKGIHPLTDEAMARRLSYFLWASLPDEELLKEARAGKLQDDAVLRAQVRRMMKDPKIEAFSREFFGQWLRYRDYLSKDTISAKTFPGYDVALREAMFEEPTRLITHLIQQNEPVDELLHSNATFVNETLARFYGGGLEKQFLLKRKDKTEWLRVEGLRSIGRGGLFGMPVILAKNSAGERTSPVKRGFWVVHHVLGQHFPPPPADVPELPKSEKESAKTIPEMLAAHTTNRSCAMCHVHFDGLGLTMEGFDAVGRARKKDLAGRDVHIVGTMPASRTPLPEGDGKGVRAEGISGLIEYIEKHRREDFERNLCRKFLGYALGRSVVLSDEPLLQEMQKNLRAERRFSVLFETVVLSPQFRRQRGRDFAAATP